MIKQCRRLCLGATVSWTEEAGPQRTGHAVASSQVALFRSPPTVRRQSLQVLRGAFSERGKRKEKKEKKRN
jgi:hypothetical protein